MATRRQQAIGSSKDRGFKREGKPPRFSPETVAAVSGGAFVNIPSVWPTSMSRRAFNRFEGSDERMSAGQSSVPLTCKTRRSRLPAGRGTKSDYMSRSAQCDIRPVFLQRISESSERERCSLRRSLRSDGRLEATNRNISIGRKYSGILPPKMKKLKRLRYENAKQVFDSGDSADYFIARRYIRDVHNTCDAICV
jgi:hypothetical protein